MRRGRPAQAPTDAQSPLTRSLRVRRREPEGPACDGRCLSRRRRRLSSTSVRAREFIRQPCDLLPVIRSSFPRRQQHRRLRRAAASGAGATAAGAVAIIALAAGAPTLAGALALVTVGLLLDTRRWLRLASRSRVGARSEHAVRAALAALEAEGRQLRPSLPYRGHGDIDSVAIAPNGIACVIETKTRTFHASHLAKTREMAARLCRHRRRWCRAGALAVLCVVGARSLERVEDDVLIVSLDRLVPALRVHAGTSPRPRFLAAQE